MKKKDKCNWSTEKNWTHIKDGDIELWKDQHTNIVVVVNHKTKVMHASDKVIKEIKDERKRRKL